MTRAEHVRLRILLVEDSDDDAELLRAALRHTGFVIERADRLAAAIALLDRTSFDVVLLDLTLPDSHGFETFTGLRLAAPGVAIIVFTGLDDEQLGLRAVREGAQDYLVKGDAGTALLVRAIRYAFERQRAEELTAECVDELRAHNATMQDELGLAREVQESLLPRRYPVFGRDPGALRFCHRYAPAGVVGGDFFDVSTLADGRAGVLICDVMGHGVRAALVTAMLKALVGARAPGTVDPAQVLAHLNDGLRGGLRATESPMFVSGFYAIIDADVGAVAFANAGHPSQLWLHSRTGQVEPLQGKLPPGRVLGLFDEPSWTTGHCTLEPGDRVLFFTDGVYEVDGPGGDSFGQRRLTFAVSRGSALPAAQLVDGLFSEVRGFSSSGGFEDDACALLLDFRGGAVESQSQTAP